MFIYLPGQIKIIEMTYSIELTDKQWFLLNDTFDTDNFIVEMEKETGAKKIVIFPDQTILFTLNNTTETAETGLEKIMKFFEKFSIYIDD